MSPLPAVTVFTYCVCVCVHLSFLFYIYIYIIHPSVYIFVSVFILVCMNLSKFSLFSVCVDMCIFNSRLCVYIYVCVCVVHSISFQTFFVLAFKIVVKLLKIQYVIAIHLECFRLLFDHLVWIEHQFFEWHKRLKEGRESVRDDERCGRSKEVNTPELIGQKVRVRVTMLRF